MARGVVSNRQELDCQHAALIRLARHSHEIEMRSTSEVFAHHLKCFAARDLDGLMSDYAADAVFFTPTAS